MWFQNQWRPDTQKLRRTYWTKVLVDNFLVLFNRHIVEVVAELRDDYVNLDRQS
jgi:hypothetical protein